MWPGATEFEVASYVTEREPPTALVTSVRAVVHRGASVLIFDDDRSESHVLPGGRREGDESLRTALERELLEEIGCTIKDQPRLIGTLHFRRLSELSPSNPYFGTDPDFLQVVFDVTTVDDPIEAAGDPWVRRPRFVLVHDLTRVPLRVTERVFVVS
jgi:8-oxo-dGTP pyrophosphatase MutT (NUDIX family)